MHDSKRNSSVWNSCNSKILLRVVQMKIMKKFPHYIFYMKKVHTQLDNQTSTVLQNDTKLH